MSLEVTESGAERVSRPITAKSCDLELLLKRYWRRDRVSRKRG